jgi:hypothetical protein
MRAARSKDLPRFFMSAIDLFLTYRSFWNFSKSFVCVSADSEKASTPIGKKPVLTGKKPVLIAKSADDKAVKGAFCYGGSKARFSIGGKKRAQQPLARALSV